MSIEQKPKIMVKPLPTILDELEDYIRQVAEGARRAEKAAGEAEAHAEEAKLAGERAAEAAAREMGELLKGIGRKAMEALGTAELARAKAEEAGREAAKLAQVTADKAMGKFKELQQEHDKLKKEVLQLALAVNKAWVKGNEVYLENAPYLKE